MKSFLALLLLLSVLLAACGEIAAPPDSGAASSSGESSSEMVSLGVWGDSEDAAPKLTPDLLTLAGVPVSFGEDISPLLATLGQWESLSSFPDPAGGGERKQYLFANLALLTSPAPAALSSGAPGEIPAQSSGAAAGSTSAEAPGAQTDLLDAVILTGEGVTTGEGLFVGMETAALAPLFGSALGTPDSEGVYHIGTSSTRLSIAASEGKVTLLRWERADRAPAPVILARDISVEVGEAISYRSYITPIAVSGAPVPLYNDPRVSFDASSVDTSRVGSYDLSVSLTDEMGMTAAQNLTVFVQEKTLTEEDTRALVQSILAGSLAEPLASAATNEQKLRVVFDYMVSTSGMVYVEVHSNKDNPPFLEAYNGLTTLRGDCYTYCCMAQALLDGLGIAYRVVTRTGDRRSDHYWLLADFGDGWYHFDPCPHVFHWKKETFKLTDAELDEFTAWYNRKSHGWNYYQFDKSAFPRTPILQEDGSYAYTPYTLTYTAGEGGTVAGEVLQQVAHGATGSPVEAIPSPGCRFTGWSDGVLTATRADIAYGDAAVEAQFAPASEQ